MGLGTNSGGSKFLKPCTPLEQFKQRKKPKQTQTKTIRENPCFRWQLDTFCEIGESEFVDAVIALQRFKAL